MEDCSKLVQICCAIHNFLVEKNYPIPVVEPSIAPAFDAGDLDDAGNLEDEELDDTIPLSVSDAGEPENIVANPLNPLEEMEAEATNQVLLEKYLWY